MTDSLYAGSYLSYVAMDGLHIMIKASLCFLSEKHGQTQTISFEDEVKKGTKS